MIILTLIQNIALLVALAATYQVVESRFEKKNVGHQILSGILFGGVGIVGMMTPINFAPGIIFDGRSIILSVSGLIGGPLVAAVAATMCGVYRIWLGGGGAWVGVSVIVESAALGVVFYFLWKSAAQQIGAFRLWIFGLLVHVIMLAIFLALPGGAGPQVLRQIGLPILFFYPLATMIICQIFLDYERQSQDRKALRESEERYRAVFDNAGIGIDLLDRDGRILRVNQSLLDMLGYSEEEFRQLTFLDITPPEEREISKRNLEALMAGEIEFYRLEKRYQRKDRSILWADLTTSAIRGPNGEHSGTIGVISDITERKKAEAALRDSEEKYRLFVETANEAVFVAQDGTLRFANRRCKEITGYSEAELLFKPMIDFIYPDDREMVVQYHERRLRGADVPYTYSFRIIDKDGDTKWLSLNSVLITWAGCPAALCFASDITDRKKAEQELRESEEKFSLSFQTSPYAIIMSHVADGRIVEVNDAFVSLTGFSREEAIASSSLGLGLWVDQEDRNQVVKDLLSGKKVSDKEFQFRKQNGDIILGFFSAAVIMLRNEQYILSSINDITERKMKEEALLQSEERFRLTFQTSPDSININRLSDGVYLDVNDGFTGITGYSREDVIGKSSVELDIWHNPQDRQRLVESLQKTGYVSNLEAKFRFKDGTIITGLMSARVIMLKGEPHIVSITRNIEEWRRTQEALRESEERYRSLFEKSKDGIYLTTDEGEILEANQALLDMFGYTRDEFLGRRARELYSDPSDRDKFRNIMKEAGSVGNYPVKFRRKDGKEIDSLVTASLRLGNDGEAIGYQGIITDVTERKKLERQLLQAQKMEAVGTLAGGIAHDFNNILQVVLGFSEIVLMGKEKGDPEYEDLEKVLSAGKKGADLVQSLLTFSRKTEINPKPLNLNHQIQRVESILERTIPKIIQIDLILPDGLSAVNADSTQIEQILMNLAINARDAMPEGGRLIFETSNVTLDEAYCKTHLGSKPGDYVLLTVSDTGAGMDQNTLEHIFEPFFSTKPAGKGTGLGLAMVYGIVKQHDGYINCYSEPGVGTTFKLYFPVTEMKDESIVQHKERRLPGGSETILVVDDEELIRDLAKKILSRAGYTVLTAVNGREGLHTYQKKRWEISLIVLDLIMPEMDGKHCLKELLDINAGARVVVASGYSADGPTKEALEGGAKGFVSKPFDMGQLLQTVRKVLDETEGQGNP